MYCTGLDLGCCSGTLCRQREILTGFDSQLNWDLWIPTLMIWCICHFSHPLCFQITMIVFKEKELFQCFKVTTPAACSYWIVGFCRFHRFEHPPIFARPGDDDLDEVAVSWLFLFLWSVVFKVLSFPLPFPFSFSFFMLLILFFLCVFCSHQLVPSLPWCCVCSSIFQKISATLRYRSTYCIIWGALMRFVFPTIWSAPDYWSISPYTPFGRGGGSAIHSRRT